MFYLGKTRFLFVGIDINNLKITKLILTNNKIGAFFSRIEIEKKKKK